MRKNLYRKKQYLNWVLVMWHVWLVWKLTTKSKYMERVENFERYVIFSCYYLLILLIKRFLFCCVHSLFRFILWTVSLSRYCPFQFVPNWTLIVCSFIFAWRNFLGIWYDAQIFIFLSLQSVPLSPYSSYYWRCDHPFWPAFCGDGEDSQWLPLFSSYSSVSSQLSSEVQNKMIIMGHQILSCHVLVVRSFFIL
jgi:hypothetical protein